jgi:hypothetical protein
MSDFCGKHSFFGVKKGWGEDFFNRLFFNRGGGRVLGLMIWLMVVKFVGFKLHYLH